MKNFVIQLFKFIIFYVLFFVNISLQINETLYYNLKCHSILLSIFNEKQAYYISILYNHFRVLLLFKFKVIYYYFFF